MACCDRSYVLAWLSIPAIEPESYPWLLARSYTCVCAYCTHTPLPCVRWASVTLYECASSSVLGFEASEDLEASALGLSADKRGSIVKMPAVWSNKQRWTRSRCIYIPDHPGHPPHLLSSRINKRVSKAVLGWSFSPVWAVSETAKSLGHTWTGPGAMYYKPVCWWCCIFQFKVECLYLTLPTSNSTSTSLALGSRTLHAKERLLDRPRPIHSLLGMQLASIYSCHAPSHWHLTFNPWRKEPSQLSRYATIYMQISKTATTREGQLAFFLLLQDHLNITS